MFSIMNYLLPATGQCPCIVLATPPATTQRCFRPLRHRSKTTLSADPTRRLVGDDEHGWTGDGIFNFDGCYAKLINLTEEDEPRSLPPPACPAASWKT